MTLGRTHETADPMMELGRALGATLDLNAALVFVPVMRRFISRLRATWLGRIVPLDDAIDFHKALGHTLFALALGHTVAFVLAYVRGHAGGALGMFHTGRGLSGGIWLAVFATMWAFSLGIIRRSKRFELFYFSHLLYVVWLALVHAPRLLLFAGVAFLGFVIESVLRVRRRRGASAVKSSWPLRSGVTRLEIARPPGFVFGPGDFVFLRLPAIARHEWHPFTISSAPEVENLTVHVRSLGNWSRALGEHVERGPAAPALEAYVDGPYGSPSAHIFRSKFVVLIGAGIGVTPFASVLESIVLRTNEAGQRGGATVQKVHFFWLNNDQYSFEWFRGLLSRLESIDKTGLVDIHLCMTRARSGLTAFGLEIARDLMASSGRSDFMTGLRTHTHMGHPDWEAMLGAIAKRHAPETVDVFFCGPHGLAKKLEPLCHRLGMRFREERF